MNSTATLEQDFSLNPAYDLVSNTISLDKAPAPIITQLELMLKQKRAEAVVDGEYAYYRVNDVTGMFMSFELTREDKLSILTKAQKNITKDSVDIDPEVREYMNLHFHDLLW